MSTDYSNYLFSLKQLHKLMAEGKDDTPAAEELRDYMDKLRYHLSAAEREYCQNYSEQLYRENEKV